MSVFTFVTDDSCEEFCLDIAKTMSDIHGVSEQEAISLINQQWHGSVLVEEPGWLFHDYAAVWASRIFRRLLTSALHCNYNVSTATEQGAASFSVAVSAIDSASTCTAFYVLSDSRKLAFTSHRKANLLGTTTSSPGSQQRHSSWLLTANLVSALLAAW